MAEQEEVVNDSLREALNAAIKEHDGEASEESETLQESTDTADSGNESREAADEQASEADTSTSADLKAPGGWSPTARELWGDVPDTIRQEVSRREADIARGMQEAADARKFQERFNTELAPFEHLVRAEGATDMITAVKTLMETAQVLSSGTPQQKAARMVGLINHYGVDVNTLDGALAEHLGAPATEEAKQARAFESVIDERLKPLMDFMGNLQGQMRQAEQTRQQSLDQQIADFSAGAEFIEDVRMDMADIMDMAAKRGASLTLQEAYDKACAIHPQISEVMAKRKAAEQATRGNQSMQKKEEAASSVPSSSTPTETRPLNGQSSGDMRDDIMNAIAALQDSGAGRI